MPNDNAIIDGKYYKVYADIDGKDSNFNDAELDQFIDQASTLMEQYCRRKFISASAIELFDGDGTNKHFVRQKRITTLTSLSYWDGTAFVAITAPTYVFDSVQDTGEMYFTDGSVFWKISTPNGWKVVYIYGWAQGDMPEDLREACCEIVKWLYMRRKKAGIASETLGAKNVTYVKRTMPAKDILNGYARKIYG